MISTFLEVFAAVLGIGLGIVCTIGVTMTMINFIDKEK